MTNSQYIAALKQERDRAIQYRADKIADLEKTCKSRSNTIIEYSNKIAELAAQVQHLADINTERQLRIRQLQAMIIKNQAEDLKEQGK